MKEDQTSIESQIEQVMRARSQHFREQSESLSPLGVRRLLEKDLGLDTYALDEHKKYVKQLLLKYLSDTADHDNKGSKQKKSKDVKVEEDEQPVTEDVAKIENSPKMELLSDDEISKSVKSETSGAEVDKIPTEDMIKDALWNKATYFRSKSEELTMASVRRIVEEELKLDKFSLDSFKKLISKQLDEILNSENEAPNKTGSKSDADSSGDKVEAKVKPKKKLVTKAKLEKTEVSKKLKRPAQEADRTKKKKIKTLEETSDEKNNVSQSDDEFESHAKKSVKVKKSAQEADRTKKQKIKKSEETSGEKNKKEVVAPGYGKKVERLKSIIKACGMSVGPNIYKKAKQAPEDKREAFLIKELQELLSKEGLSANPSEKDIKDVKRRKQRAKELEGIDMSNIVGEKLRKKTVSFVPPPKPKLPIDTDDDSEDDNDDEEEGSEDSDNDNDSENENQNEDDDNDNNEKEKENEDEDDDNENENEKENKNEDDEKENEIEKENEDEDKDDNVHEE